MKRPIAFVLAATDHGTMIVNRNDHAAHENYEYGVGFQIFDASHCEAEEVEFLLDLLTLRRRYHGDGVIAIDGGANIGTHTVEWARHMHGWGRVISFEAQEIVYYALCGNIVLNNCLNVRAVAGVLGEKMGQCSVPKPDYNRAASFGSMEVRPREITEYIGQPISYAPADMMIVPMFNVDSLAITRLDLLKLDVEGMEEEVLRGAAKKIEALHPIMLIELLKSDPDAIEAFVTGFGYKTFQVGINLLAIHADDPAVEHVSAVGDALLLDMNPQSR